MWSACRAAPPVSESPGSAGHGWGRQAHHAGWLGRTGRRTALGVEQVPVERAGAGHGQAGLSMLPVPGGGGGVGLEPSIAQSERQPNEGRVLGAKISLGG